MVKFKLHEVAMIRYDRDVLERAAAILEEDHPTLARNVRILIQSFDEAPYVIEDDGA